MPDSKAVKSVKQSDEKVPGPRSLLPGGMFWEARRRGFLPFLEYLAKDFGDVVHFRVMTQDYYLVSNPEDIREILVGENEAFTKGPALRASKVTLGEGLLTSEGDLHKRQRRLM